MEQLLVQFPRLRPGYAFLQLLTHPNQPVRYSPVIKWEIYTTYSEDMPIEAENISEFPPANYATVSSSI